MFHKKEQHTNFQQFRVKYLIGVVTLQTLLPLAKGEML